MKKSVDKKNNRNIMVVVSDEGVLKKFKAPFSISGDLSNIEKYSANRSKRYDLPFAIRRESAKTAVWREES